MARFAHSIRLTLAAAVLAFPGSLRSARCEDEKPDTPSTKTAEPVARELHLVGIYEGFTKTGDRIHGGKALVTVNRPGKSVVLVLCSYEPVTWEVTAEKPTQIERVILSGYYKQAVTGIPETVPIENHSPREGSQERRLDLSPGYSPDTPRLRQATATLKRETGLELSSFQGVYRASADKPFVINKVQDDPKLASDFPQPAKPADLPKLEFSAVFILPGMFAQENTSYGEFTLLGPKKDSLSALPEKIRKVAYDPASKQYFGLTMHDAWKIDLPGGKATKVDPGLDVPRLSWPDDMTFDTKRNRLLTVTHGGEDHLYSYEPSTGKWSVIASLNNMYLQAITYHPQRDVVFGLAPAMHSDEVKSRGFLCELNSKGAVVERKALPEPFLSGLISHDGLRTHLQIVASDRYLVILACPSGFGSSDGRMERFAYTYLYDLETDKVTLASKRTIGK